MQLQNINLIKTSFNNITKINAITARELHHVLGSKRLFNDWVKPYINDNNDYGFAQGTDFIRIHAGVNPTNNVPIVDYAFSINMAKEVSMLSRTKKGKEARKYFIDCEEALNTLRYRKNDTKAQIDAMAIIGHLLPPEEAKEKVPYIKANSVVNKITSDIHGHPKMLQKDQMNLPMLETRTKLLDDYVKLFEMGFSNHLINEMLRKKLIN